MDWPGVISNVITNIVGVSQMTVCSSPDLEAWRRSVENRTQERSLKLVGSASHDHDFCCPPVVDSATWLSVIGGLAIVTFFLRMQIINIIGRKRRKREEQESSLTNILESVYREESAESDSVSSGWVRDLVTEMMSYNETEDPEPGPHTDSCLARTWRCVSGSVEDLLHHLDSDTSVVTVIQSVLARLVFHGTNTSMWTSAMRIPKVRTVVECVRSHDQCVARSILREELQTSRRV